MSVARDGTRLENDDGEHCKRCGWELPGTHTDEDGNRIIWNGDKGDWEVIEVCPECWTKRRLKRLRTECMERYNGACSEVLWNA